MNYKHGRFKRLFAMFLVLVMLATSGNGYSMQVWAQEDQNVTGQTEAASTESETSTPETTGVTALSETTAETPQPESEVSQTQADTAQTEAQSQSAEQTTAQSETTALESVQESTEGQDGSQTESTGQSQTTAETTAPETTAPESQTAEQPAAANGIMTMEAGASREFNFGASINESGNSSAEILSGGSFTYIIGYTVPPTSAGENYTSMTLQIDLSEFDGRLTVAPNAEVSGGLDVIGEDVETAYYVPAFNTLNIRFKQVLTTGTGRTISIRFVTDNFNWEDGEEIKLNPQITGSTSGGTNVSGSLEPGKEPTVTVKADDGWQVEKSVGTVTSDDDYYYVPYTITLQNTTSDGPATDTDRMGRLAMTGFSLEDILPLPDNGQTNEAGEHIGYPNGGAAAEVTDVTMNNEPLTAREDYEYTPGGTSITFYKMAQSSAAGSYTEAGTPVNTTYRYTVKYPKTPYLTPANAAEAEKYWLQNTADLHYTLLGESERQDQDTAEISLGEKAPAGAFNNLTVQKVVSIGGDEYAFSEDLYGTVSFGLYMDEDCTQIAQNYNGSVAAGTPQDVGSNGQVTFYQLAAGTYYLKETAMGNGLSNADSVIQVIIAEDGTVTLGSGETTAVIKNNQVKVTNQADDYGNLEFYKYGKNSEGTTNPLAGAEFSLTSTDGPKVYTAVSDNSGRVFFEGVPAGDYILKETKVPSDEYTVNPTEIPVTIRGKQMNYPENLPNEDNIASVGQAPVYENVSEKGKFKFRKEDSTDHKTLIGAQFMLYGPFENETSEIPEESTPVQYNGHDYILRSDSSDVTSIALEAGWYIMQEITPPEGYAIMGNGLTPVQVTANTISNTYVIENVEKVPLTINKVGTIQNTEGNVVNTEQLAGAVFEIYDSNAEGAKPIATVETYLDGSGNSVSGIRQENGSHETLYLAPGTYYYKEVQAPEGYEIMDRDLQKFNLTSDHTTVTVTNSADFGEILIKKVDSKDPSKGLTGAVFGVYSDQDCTTPVMDSDGNTQLTIKTSGDGTGRVRVPANSDGSARTYYLKEITPPDGYASSDAVIPVSVTKNQQTQVDPIENTELRSIVITKNDSVTNAPLEDVSFDMWGPFDDNTLSEEEIIKGNFQRRTTDSNGTCTFSGLQPGKYYYIREASTPDGYVTNTTGQWVQTTAESDAELSVSVTVTNVRFGKIIVNKTTTMDAENGVNPPYAGVTFTLYHAKHNGTDWVADGDPVASGTTNSSGALTFDKVVPGDYLLVETLPDADKDAYEAKEPIPVKVTAGYNQGAGYPSGTVQVTNKATKGKLELDKVSSTNTATHIAATFDIFKDTNNDGEPDGDAVTTITTTGTATPVLSGWLEPGHYVLVETAVTGSYALDATPIPFKITEGQTTSLTGDEAVKNDPLGQLIFSKVASFDIAGSTGETVDYGLAGSVIRLYKKTSEYPSKDITAANYETPAAEINMTNSTTGTTDPLEPGEYWIVETVFPDGYYAKNPEEFFDLKINGESVKVTVIDSCEVKPGATSTDDPIVIRNYTDKGKLRINKWKYDAENRYKTPLNRAKFELYKVVDANTPGAIQGPEGNSVILVEGASSTDAEGKTFESGTHGVGSALSLDLEAGTYYIREIFTADNPNHQLYYGNGESAGFSWYPYGGEWSGQFKIESGKETIVNFENFQMVGPGYKTDEISKEPISGAVFAAFSDEKAATAFVGYLRSQNIVLDEDQRNKLEVDLKDASFLVKNGIVDVSTPSAAGTGRFEFYALEPGKPYYIVEVLPPAGYALNENVF